MDYQECLGLFWGAKSLLAIDVPTMLADRWEYVRGDPLREALGPFLMAAENEAKQAGLVNDDNLLGASKGLRYTQPLFIVI
jgi:hypothetical protein